MKTVRHACVVGMLPLALILVEGRAADGPEPQRREISEFMKRKLKHSQALLEALAVGDFRALADHADALKKIGGEAQWKLPPNLTYIRYSEEFTRLAADIAGAAREKDLNGATLSYARLTINCVDCRRFTRDNRILDPKLREGRP